MFSCKITQTPPRIEDVNIAQCDFLEVQLFSVSGGKIKTVECVLWIRIWYSQPCNQRLKFSIIQKDKRQSSINQLCFKSKECYSSKPENSVHTMLWSTRKKASWHGLFRRLAKAMKASASSRLRMSTAAMKDIPCTFKWEKHWANIGE